MAHPVVPFRSPPTRWRWGFVAMIGATGAAWVASARYGAKAGLAVLLMLLAANALAAELGRRRAT